MPADATVLRSKHVTLSAATAYWLAITGPWDYVEILNRDAIGGDVCYVAVGDANTTAPTAAGDDSIAVLPQQSVVLRLPSPGRTAAGVDSVRAVKMISAGTPDMSVTGF
jgi:hypothetical protein